MKVIGKTIFIFLLFLVSLNMGGCAFLANRVVGSKGIEIPQIVAYLEPLLRENKIMVLGKIIIQNPTESNLDLDKIYLTLKDQDDRVLGENILEWEEPSVVSKKELEAPVKIDLDLAVLNEQSIAIFVRTAFIYKALGLRIPIESKVAVLSLDALKEIISHPLQINIYTKLDSRILGNSSIEYVLSVTNPLRIDLVFEDGLIGIYTFDGKEIVADSLASFVFRGSGSNQIKGTIRIGNIFGKLIREEFAKRRPLRFHMSGKLRVPRTEISMPFDIESVQEIGFSLFGRK